MNYLPGPWFRFASANAAGVRWCQPDGLLFLPLSHLIIIIEVKLQHTSDAWWQVMQLYLPVVAKLFPPDLWRYAYCEVTKWYDPATSFPCPVRKIPDPSLLDPGQFGVHICKGDKA